MSRRLGFVEVADSFFVLAMKNLPCVVGGGKWPTEKCTWGGKKSNLWMRFWFYGIIEISMRTLEIQAVVWKEGRQYVAQCLDVDVSSFGSTEKSALAHLREAVVLHFEGKKFPRVLKVKKPSLASFDLVCA